MNIWTVVICFGIVGVALGTTLVISAAMLGSMRNQEQEQIVKEWLAEKKADAANGSQCTTVQLSRIVKE